MLDAVKDVIVGGALQLFDELLWDWTSVIERTVRLWHPEDVPWWYNERASLSLFAGAIWKAGGIAFEEFSSEREAPRGTGGTTVVRRLGRIDLYFSFQGEDFVAEAKQCWPRVGSRAQSSKGEIERMLQQASADVQTVPAAYGQRLALVFASPYFPKAELGDAQECLSKWKQAVESVDSDGKAFYWLHDCERAEDNGNLYPGTTIFLKQVAA